MKELLPVYMQNIYLYRGLILGDTTRLIDFLERKSLFGRVFLHVGRVSSY